MFRDNNQKSKSVIELSYPDKGSNGLREAQHSHLALSIEAFNDFCIR